MDVNIDFKHIYKKTKDPSQVAKEVKEIFNQVDLIAFGKYNKLPEQNLIQLVTSLNIEKMNLESKQSEIEGLINSLKTKLDELRINLNGIFYLSQFDTSFNHFKNIQAQLIELKKGGYQVPLGTHSSSLWIEDKNGTSIQFKQPDLAKLFNYLCSIYAKFNDDLGAFTAISKDLEGNLQAIETHLVKLDKIVLKKKIKLNMKDSTSMSINLSNISELMSENILGYLSFNILSWLVPTLIVVAFIALLIWDPLNFVTNF